MHVATYARPKRNVPRPEYHRQRKTAQRKGLRRHHRYQARVRSLTGSAPSPGQSQGYWRQRWRLVCVHDLAGSLSSPNQHRWHRRQRRSLTHVRSLAGSVSSPYQRQGYRRQHLRWASVHNVRSQEEKVTGVTAGTRNAFAV